MAKFIFDQKKYVDKLYLSLTAFTSSVIEYRNLEFTDEIIDTLVEDEDNLDQD